MILRSTINRIEAQLESLCNHLGIDHCDRDGIFYKDGDNVVVSIGEINMGTGYKLSFDSRGTHFRTVRESWTTEGDIRTVHVWEKR